MPNKRPTADPRLLRDLLICVMGPIKRTWMVFLIILDYKAKRYTDNTILYNVSFSVTGLFCLRPS